MCWAVAFHVGTHPQPFKDVNHTQEGRCPATVSVTVGTRDGTSNAAALLVHKQRPSLQNCVRRRLLFILSLMLEKKQVELDDR